MKSNELFKQIHSGRIKEGTKIKVINELTGNWITTISYKNGRLNWQAGEFDTSFLCNIDIDFEVIEEKKEIEELNDTNYNCEEMSIEETNCYNNLIRTKLNEVIRAVNKINKQLEEQETEDIDTVERELNKMF